MSKTIIPTLQLRAEKTTRNRDDLRVMIAGTLFCIFLIIVQPFVFKIYDDWYAERPFVRAIVQVYYVEGRNFPMIFYDVDATQPVDGKWRATLHTAEGSRITTRRGDGSYNDKEDIGKLWTWEAWFETDSESGPPALPDESFFACVSYIVEARDSGSQDETPEPYCSNLYDPTNPTPVPEEFPTDDDFRP